MLLYVFKHEAQAREYIETRLKEMGKAYTVTGSDDYDVEMEQADGLAFMNEIIEKFPDIYLSGTFFSDVDGRDFSFWSSVRFEAVKGDDGKSKIVCKGGSSGWA